MIASGCRVQANLLVVSQLVNLSCAITVTCRAIHELSLNLRFSQGTVGQRQMGVYILGQFYRGRLITVHCGMAKREMEPCDSQATCTTETRMIDQQNARQLRLARKECVWSLLGPTGSSIQSQRCVPYTNKSLA